MLNTAFFGGPDGIEPAIQAGQNAMQSIIDTAP